MEFCKYSISSYIQMTEKCKMVIDRIYFSSENCQHDACHVRFNVIDEANLYSCPLDFLEAKLRS
jgi:hypothetical protein